MTELCVALDLPSAFDARVTVLRLGGLVGWFKVGPVLELDPDFLSLVRWLKDRGSRVMLDRKLRDIPSVVGEYADRAQRLGVNALTVECRRESLVAAAGRGPLVLAVGRLTSEGYVGAMHDAAVAIAASCGMVVHPAALDPVVRQGLTIAATGVRRPGTDTDDHAAAVAPDVVASMGAWLAIVGRPIVRAPDPARAAALFLEDLARGVA